MPLTASGSRTSEQMNPWPAFADLLSATTLLFLVLFAAIAIPALQRAGQQRTTLVDIRSALDSFAAGRSEVKVSAVGDYVRVRIEERATFPKDSSSLSSLRQDGRDLLRDFGRYLRAGAGAVNVTTAGSVATEGVASPSTGLLELVDQIQIVGHTSSEGSDERNWMLSASRAATVALFLIDSVELDPCVVTALGRSKYYPFNPDSAKQLPVARPIDRRIELEIRPRVVGDQEQARRRGECVSGRA